MRGVRSIADMERYARWGGVIVLAVLTWRFASAPLDGSSQQSFLHLPNLIFHEAGHVIFSPFGRFMTVLGGSLFQILVPLICAISFAYQYEDRFAAAVCTWWAGQNVVDVAPYIADARKLQLTLIGGRTGAEVEGHDWEYLLMSIGWLHLDERLGRAALVAGTLVMVGAIVWAVIILLRQREAVIT
jgi:hypothetical protein